MELFHSPYNAGVWLYHAYGGVRCIVVSALSVRCMVVSDVWKCLVVSGVWWCQVYRSVWWCQVSGGVRCVVILIYLNINLVGLSLSACMTAI